MSETRQAHRGAESVESLSSARTVGLAAAGLSLIAVCYGLARFAYGLFMPTFREAFTLTATQAGLIASAGYAAYCVGTVAATAVTPRFGARAVAVAAGCLATVGTGLVALAPTGVVLALGITVAGSSTGLASPPLAQAIANRVAPAHRDRVQTIVNAGTGLGVTVSGPVALLAHDRWRAAWFAFAAVAAVVTVWVRFRVPDDAGRSPAAGGHAGPAAARHFALPSGAAALFGAAALLGAVSAATWTFGRELLVTEGEHSDAVATAAWIVLGASGLLGAGSGDLTRRLGLPRAWAATMLAMCGATAVLAAAPQQTPVAVGASAAFGAVYIAGTGVLLIWSTRIYPTRPATGVGFTFLLLAVGQAVSSPLLGLVADRTSLAAAFWISASAALVAGVLRPTQRGHTS